MSRPRGSGRRFFENFPRLERKKRLGSLALQAPAGLLPGASPRRWIAFLFAFYSDPRPRRFLPTFRSPVASPPPPQAPPEEHRGSDRGDPRSRAGGGTAERRTAVGWEAASTDTPVYFILVGAGRREGPPPCFPTPSSQGRESQDSGSPSGGLAGISALDLGLIIAAWLYYCHFYFILFLPKGERQKTQNCGIYLT